MVDRGELQATIVLRSNGGPAVELLAQFAEGKPIPPRTLQQPTSYPPEDDLRRRVAQRPH
jgi:hypothetical protein